jgi:hypothetical protein
LRVFRRESWSWYPRLKIDEGAVTEVAKHG